MGHDDIIDFRDLTARVEELEEIQADADEARAETDVHVLADPAYTPPEDEEGLSDEEAEELRILTDLLAETKGYGGDHQWRGDWYPGMMIAADHFEEYARSFADDIGAIDGDAKWPANHIDWPAAAEELRTDYSEIEVDGRVYFYR